MSNAQIHPTAIVDAKVEIGAGTLSDHTALSEQRLVLVPNCWLQHHVTLAGQCVRARQQVLRLLLDRQQTQT